MQFNDNIFEEMIETRELENEDTLKNILKKLIEKNTGH